MSHKQSGRPIMNLSPVHMPCLISDRCTAVILTMVKGRTGELQTEMHPAIGRVKSKLALPCQFRVSADRWTVRPDHVLRSGPVGTSAHRWRVHFRLQGTQTLLQSMRLRSKPPLDRTGHRTARNSARVLLRPSDRRVLRIGGSTHGVLEPEALVGASGATSTVRRVDWSGSSAIPGKGTATVIVTGNHSPAEVLDEHIVDFTELDGSVSVDMADSTVESDHPRPLRSTGPTG